MGHKIYISFKTEDSLYKEAIQNSSLDCVDKSLDVPINSTDHEYIMQTIRSEYLSDSTVTILLIGQYGAESRGAFEQRFIKSELQGSLYDGQYNTKNGILGVVLPDTESSVYRGSITCSNCGGSHNIVAINDSTTIKEFSYNYYIPNGKCAWPDDDRYCVLTTWTEFAKNPEYYIDAAFAKENSADREQDESPPVKGRAVKNPRTEVAMKFPDLYDTAESISANAQRRFLWARASELIALVVAAAIGLLPNHAVHGIGPPVAVGFFLIALFVRVSRVGANAEKQWYDARAVAESVKSSSWQYAVGGEAFRIADADADHRFVESLQKVVDLLQNLEIPATPGASAAASDNMRTLRGSNQAERAASYLSNRVEDQVGWYSRMALWNGARAKWWLRMMIAVEASTVVLGALRMLGVFDVDWLGLLAVVAAAAAAWQQSKNYASLNEAYSVTSHEIAFVRDSLRQVSDEDAWAQAVHDAEAAFSREHTLWLARRQGPRSDGTPA